MRTVQNLVIIAATMALGGCGEVILGGAAVTGVAVVQERSVGAAMDDTVIQADILRRLFEHNESLFTKVSLEVVEGRVLMTGVVPKPDDRVEAGRIAWMAKGVKEVINEVQVTDKSGLLDFAKDSWITTRVRATMLADRNISDINYNIETVNGIIYLMGIAQNQQELERVVNHARNVPGVVEVKSYVRLKDDPRRTGS